MTSSWKLWFVLIQKSHPFANARYDGWDHPPIRPNLNQGVFMVTMILKVQGIVNCPISILNVPTERWFVLISQVEK